MKLLLLAGTYYSGMMDVVQEYFSSTTVILSELNGNLVNNRIINLCKSKGINYVLANRDIQWTNLSDSVDVIFSIGWRRILGDDFFEIFSNTLVVNIHPAILPYYKGYHTEPYVIFNNESKHGITAHYLTKQLDAGEIIHTLEIGINEYDTVKSLKSKIDNRFQSFFVELCHKLQSGKFQTTSNNPDLTKVIAPKRSPEDSQIDSSKSIDDLYHKLRALQGDAYMPYFERNDGVKVYIKLYTKRENKHEYEI